MKKYDTNNIFAKILRQEIPCDKVFEDDNVLAFHDISHLAPVHVLVIPKGEYLDLEDFTQNAPGEIIADFFAKVSQVAKKLDLSASGYRIISNKGGDASQSVPHFHVHILGKKKLGPLIMGDKSH